MDEPVDLNTFRDRREVEALVQEALASPPTPTPTPNDIDLRGMVLKCDGAVSGNDDAFVQRVVLFDISTGTGIALGALTVDAEQWGALKSHVDRMFTAFEQRPRR